MRIRFYLDTRTRANGDRRFKFRISHQGESKPVTTDFYCSPKGWNQKFQSHRESHVNEYIDAVAKFFSRMESDLIKEGCPVTASLLRDQYIEYKTNKEREEEEKPEEKKEYSFLEYFDYFREKYKGTKDPEHMRKSHQIEGHLNKFNPDLTFQDITHSFYNEYVEYLVSEAYNRQTKTVGLANNTISKHIKFIRGICKDAASIGYKVPPDYKDFPDIGHDVRPVWLTWQEVETLLNYPTSNLNDRILIDDFVLRCYTGLRNSDLDQLDKHHFHKRKNHWFVHIEIEKTESVVNIPIHNKAVALFEKYDFSIPKFSMQHKNRRLKELAGLAGLTRGVEVIRHIGKKKIVQKKPINDTISTHTARRTFGRKYMEETGDIFKLSKILRQSDIKITIKYIGWEDEELAESLNSINF